MRSNSGRYSRQILKLAFCRVKIEMHFLFKDLITTSERAQALREQWSYYNWVESLEPLKAPNICSVQIFVQTSKGFPPKELFPAETDNC